MNTLDFKKRKITHSVLCVTYNQEQYIEKAITSLFAGKVWPDEVVILDDCSTDGTREMIEILKAKYPAQIRAIYNPKNLGVCGNLNQLIGLPVGDMVHLLAGDDWEEPGMFERMNKEIEDRGLDPGLESFMLIPDFYYYDGKALVRHFNDKECLTGGILKATIRQRVVHRMVGLSAKLFEKYPLYDEKLGLWADYHQVVDLVRHCDHAYLIDAAYPVYRTGVGVASKETLHDLTNSFYLSVKSIKTEIQGDLDKYDSNYLDYLIVMHQTLLSPSMAAFFKYSYVFIINLRNGVRKTDYKLVLSRVISRIRTILSKKVIG